MIESIAIGIDPGIRHCAFAVVKFDDGAETLLDAKTIFTKPLKVHDAIPHIYDVISRAINMYQPSAVGIEDWRFYTGTGVTWEAQATQRLIGALYLLSRDGQRMYMLEPGHWKRGLVGGKRCSKEDLNKGVEWVVRHRILNTTGKKFDEHCIDAMGAALVTLDNLKLDSLLSLEERATLNGTGDDIEKR